MATFLRSDEETPATRDQLEAWLVAYAPQLDKTRRADILLDANELFCNAFEHGDGSGCMFDMRRIGAHLTLTVTNAAADADIAETSGWTMPGVDARSGRGLAIVQTVADGVRLRRTPVAISVTATFVLRAETPTRAGRDTTLAL